MRIDDVPPWAWWALLAFIAFLVFLATPLADAIFTALGWFFGLIPGEAWGWIIGLLALVVLAFSVKRARP